MDMTSLRFGKRITPARSWSSQIIGDNLQARAEAAEGDCLAEDLLRRRREDKSPGLAERVLNPRRGEAFRSRNSKD